MVPLMWQCRPVAGAPTLPGASRVRARGDGAPCAAELVELLELPALAAVPEPTWLVQLVHQRIAVAAEAIESQPRIDVFIDTITAVTPAASPHAVAKRFPLDGNPQPHGNAS